MRAVACTRRRIATSACPGFRFRIASRIARWLGSDFLAFPPTRLVAWKLTQSPYAWSADRELSADQFTLRIDHSLSDKHKMFVRYSFHDNRMDDPSSNLGAPYLAYPELGRARTSTRAARTSSRR